MILLATILESLSLAGFLGFGFLLVPSLLALPVFHRGGTLGDFYKALAICLFGIWIPIVVFILKAGLTPVSKNQARLGWLDCFAEGSVWLLPLVLFASWGFYRLQVMGKGERAGKWPAAAVFIGTIVSCGCTVFWFVRVALGGSAESGAVIVVPVYVSIWYLGLSIRIFRESARGWVVAFWSSLATVPFWFASVVASQRIYAELPETVSDCFVVTAARGGHACIVGPLFTVERQGRVQLVNTQLLRFWEFEAAWKERYPNFHRSFRWVYNRIGPIAAGCIRRPVLADVAFLALKPVEFCCSAALRVWRHRWL